MEVICGVICFAVFVLILGGGIAEIIRCWDAKQIKKEMKSRQCCNCSKCWLLVNGKVKCERFQETAPQPDFCDGFNLRKAPLQMSTPPMPKSKPHWYVHECKTDESSVEVNDEKN